MRILSGKKALQEYITDRTLTTFEHVVRAMGTGTLGGVDGGQAFKSACHKAASPPLEGVIHQGNIFTPLVRLNKNLLTNDVVTTLRNAAKDDKSPVLETRTQFLVVGGNNAAEGVHGHLNNTLRHGTQGWTSF